MCYFFILFCCVIISFFLNFLVVLLYVFHFFFFFYFSFFSGLLFLLLRYFFFFFFFSTFFNFFFFFFGVVVCCVSSGERSTAACATRAKRGQTSSNPGPAASILRRPARWNRFATSTLVAARGKLPEHIYARGACPHGVRRRAATGVRCGRREWVAARPVRSPTPVRWIQPRASRAGRGSLSLGSFFTLRDCVGEQRRERGVLRRRRGCRREAKVRRVGKGGMSAVVRGRARSPPLRRQQLFGGQSALGTEAQGSQTFRSFRPGHRNGGKCAGE